MANTSLDKFDSHDSVMPIFRQKSDRNTPEQFGSAVVVEWHGHTFLLTAAHVTDELRGEFEVLLPVAGGALETLRGDFRFIDVLPEQSRSEDAIDVAYVRLTPDLAPQVAQAFTPVPAAAIDFLPAKYWSNEYPCICSATGYPTSKARLENGAHSIDIWSYAGTLITDDATYDRLGFSKELNILLRYDRTKTINLNHAEPRIASAPNLKGVSGGGIFLWPDFPDDVDSFPPVFGRKLVGIVHSYLPHENLIVGSSLLSTFTMMMLGEMKGWRA